MPCFKRFFDCFASQKSLWSCHDVQVFSFAFPKPNTGNPLRSMPAILRRTKWRNVCCAVHMIPVQCPSAVTIIPWNTCVISKKMASHFCSAMYIRVDVCPLRVCIARSTRAVLDSSPRHPRCCLTRAIFCTGSNMVGSELATSSS